MLSSVTIDNYKAVDEPVPFSCPSPRTRRLVTVAIWFFFFLAKNTALQYLIARLQDGLISAGGEASNLPYYYSICHLFINYY